MKHGNQWTLRVVFMCVCNSFKRTPGLFRQKIPDVQRKIPAQATKNASCHFVKYKRGLKRPKSLSLLSYLYLLEHVRMVADLPQLHDGVHQCLCASFTLKHIKHPVSDM